VRSCECLCAFFIAPLQYSDTLKEVLYDSGDKTQRHMHETSVQFKRDKILRHAIILTNENYKVIQIKKNLVYLVKRIKMFNKSKSYTELLGKQIEL
jgi:hypothetical protein